MEYHDSCQKIIVSLYQKTLQGNPFMYDKNPRGENFVDKRAWDANNDFLLDFLSHKSKTFRRGTVQFFKKFLVSRNIVYKRAGERVSRFSIGVFVASGCQKAHRGPSGVSEHLLCRKKNC